MISALIGGTGADWETQDVPVPKPGPGQVLVGAHAVAFNEGDTSTLAADPTTGGSGQQYRAGFEFACEVTASGQGGPRVAERVMGTTDSTTGSEGIRTETGTDG